MFQKLEESARKMGEELSNAQGNTDLLTRQIPNPEAAGPSKHTEAPGICQTSTDKTIVLIRKENRT